MTAILNGKIVNGDLKVGINDRAMQFGDGLFETIAIRNKKSRNLSYHLDRLESGCEALGMAYPGSEVLIRGINRIIELNDLDNSTVKLMLWRKPSGKPGYDFDSGEVNILVKSKAFKVKPLIIEKADFAQNIYFTYTTLSRYKTLNSLPYILAARERNTKNLDELIVLNDRGMICECVSSNIFWVKGKNVFTPLLETGCLDGTMRRFIIEKLKVSEHFVQEVKAGRNEVLNADCVFTTNSAGIRIIKNIGSHKFATSSKIFNLIKKANEE